MFIFPYLVGYSLNRLQTEPKNRFSESTTSLTYNKWYIKPQFRMKKPLRTVTQ